MRIASCLLALAASAEVLCAGPTTASQPAGQESHQFDAILLDGNKMGYTTLTRRQSDTEVVTVSVMHLALRRGPVAINVDATTTCRETLDGKPLAMSYVQTMGPLTSKVDGTIADGKFTYTSFSSVGGQTKPKTITWPDGALLSEGLERLSRAKGFAQGTRYTARTFSPDTLQAVDSQVIVGGKEKVDLLGRVVMLTRTDMTLATSAGGVADVTYVNDRGECLKLISTIAGLKMEIVSCSCEYALSKDNPPDFLTKLLLTSPRPLSAKQKALAVTYRLAPKPGADLQFPSDKAQSARKQPDGSWTLTVDPSVAEIHDKIPYTGCAPWAIKALKPSRYVESDSAKIVATARAAIGETTDALQAARKLEAFVRTYIDKKDLSVGYATAAEVLETRQGDCTEHAVLLAALCRAVGIPAQVVDGMAYMPQWAGRRDVFGPHAWVRVYVAGRWVHIDAALGYDAGHIMLGAGNGDPDGFFSLVGTLGNFTLADVQPASPAPTTQER